MTIFPTKAAFTSSPTAAPPPRPNVSSAAWSTTAPFPIPIFSSPKETESLKHTARALCRLPSLPLSSDAPMPLSSPPPASFGRCPEIVSTTAACSPRTALTSFPKIIPRMRKSSKRGRLFPHKNKCRENKKYRVKDTRKYGKSHGKEIIKIFR